MMNTKNIIAIDKNTAVSLDNAFSIAKKGNEYEIDVYIANPVTFLNDNRELAKLAYEIGKNCYVPTSDGTVRITMLPEDLVNDVFSLNTDGSKNVIQFTFNIDTKGNILKHDVKLSNINVNYLLDKTSAVSIMNGSGLSVVYKDLKNLGELTNILHNKYTSLKYDDEGNKIQSTPSLLVNRLIAKDADLAIYRDKTKYTKEKTNTTHSSTPLRRMVSNINLGLYLYQKGLCNLSDKDIYTVEDNMDEIIAHLNEVEVIDKSIDHGKKVLTKKRALS